MKTHRFVVALTLLNLALLIFTLAQLHPARAQGTAPVLRGRALEIVDEQGRVRASINVYPASAQKNGEVSAESVLLRLITERGRPSVKISASEQSAGLALVGPTGTKDTYVQLGAWGTASSLRLKNEDGGERVVKPQGALRPGRGIPRPSASRRRRACSSTRRSGTACSARSRRPARTSRPSARCPR